MRLFVTFLMIFTALNLFGLDEFDYNLEKESNLLLVKQVDGKTKLIFQEKDENWIINIYDFDGLNNIEFDKSINLDSVILGWVRDVQIYSLDYINETLYLDVLYSAKDELNSIYLYNKFLITDGVSSREFESDDEIEDVQMYNDKEGLFLKGDTIFVTWDNWETIEKQVFDKERIALKIGYMGSLRDVILCERNYNASLIEYFELDLLNSSLDYTYSHPIDYEKYKDYYKPYTVVKRENNDIYVSYEYASEDSIATFEIAKSSNNGLNWEKLYESELESIFKYEHWWPSALKMNKIEFIGNKILAVNFEQILYSSDSGATWKEYKHIFPYEFNNNIFPKFIDGNPYVFSRSSTIKIEGSTGITHENALEIYPNPAKENVKVSFDAIGNENLNNIKLQLVNISSGETYAITNYEVNRNNANKIEINLNIEEYITGAYLLKLSIGNISKVEKLIIE